MQQTHTHVRLRKPTLKLSLTQENQCPLIRAIISDNQHHTALLSIENVKSSRRADSTRSCRTLPGIPPCSSTTRISAGVMVRVSQHAVAVRVSQHAAVVRVPVHDRLRKLIVVALSRLRGHWQLDLRGSSVCLSVDLRH